MFQRYAMARERSIDLSPDLLAREASWATATSVIAHALVFLAFFTVNLKYVPRLQAPVVTVELASEDTKVVIPFLPGRKGADPKNQNLAKNAAYATRPQETAPPKPGLMEETVSLDSREPRYYDYLFEVKTRIENFWQFPDKAREKRVQGRLFMGFSIASSGGLSRIRLLRSSGHSILDRAAASAVSSAAPFPPFPKSLELDLLHIRASFDYRLTR